MRIPIVRNYKLPVILLYEIDVIFPFFHMLYLPKPFQGQFLSLVVGMIAAIRIIAETEAKTPQGGVIWSL